MAAGSGDNRILIYSGRDKTIKFTLTTSDPSPETPYDLSGAKVWLTVKDEMSDSDSQALASKRNDLAGGDATQVNITDPTGGELEVYFVPSDTVNLKGDYWWDLVVENSSGKRMQAVPPSRFKVNITVTKLDT